MECLFTSLVLLWKWQEGPAAGRATTTLYNPVLVTPRWLARPLVYPEREIFCAEDDNVITRIAPRPGMALIFNHHILHEGQQLESYAPLCQCVFLFFVFFVGSFRLAHPNLLSFAVSTNTAHAICNSGEKWYALV